MSEIEDIKKKYPNPIPYPQDEVEGEEFLKDKTKYSVGGAFCMHTGLNLNFPDKRELMLVFQKYLGVPCYIGDTVYGHEWARDILHLNQQGMMDLAWNELEEIIGMKRDAEGIEKGSKIVDETGELNHIEKINNGSGEKQ